MKISSIIIYLTVCLSSTLKSQSSKNTYDQIVYQIQGDLNKDSLPDLVIVKEDQKSKYNPYLFEIKFRDKNGKFTRVFSSETVVMNKFPQGDRITEAILENLEIKNGIIIFSNQLIRGRLINKFRYQNGNFELIGYTFNNASTGFIEYIDYNLSTGKKISKKTDYQTDKILEFKETTEKIKPLPKLQDFKPRDLMY